MMQRTNPAAGAKNRPVSTTVDPGRFLTGGTNCSILRYVLRRLMLLITE